MLKQIVSPASAGGKGLILVALVGFLSGLLGVFVGFTVHGSGLTVHGERETRRQGDKETRRQGDKERGRWGDGEMRSGDERLIIGKEKTTGHILLDPGTGNVGIGVPSPAEKLDVDGAIKLGTTATTNTGTIRWSGTNFEGYTGTVWRALDVQAMAGGGWTDDGTVVRLTTGTDSVGIGTTTPGTKLDVVGTARMTGFQLGTSATDGHVLTTNVSGVGTWQAAGGGLPTGVIVMWSGCTTAIPTGWALCDGRTVGGVTTPDLRDRFIYGIGTGENPGAIGGTSSYSLTVAQLPPHRHTGTTDIAGAHTHRYWNVTHWTRYYRVRTSGATVADDQWSWDQTSTAGAHTHTFTTDATGLGAAIDNRPAFFKLAFIMKL